ncbi:MAG: TetR/AcrR family transcriptional regulator [Cognatishimia sp.]|uniref:TetR/AcrR family transcriptional regulator n=1 Tax=Cognatishimia sp. TaxID=2211648 RepID=UPI003B8BC5D0
MNEKKPRGRPKKYDPEQALDRLTAVFWEKGFDAASLDELARAAGMNRPSLYAAFGDKEAMFLATQRRFAKQFSSEVLQRLQQDGPILEVMAASLDHLIATYQTGIGRGCYAFSVGAMGAAYKPKLARMFDALFQDMEMQIAHRLASAQKQGEITADTDVELLARVLTASMNGLAVRSRAGGDAGAMQDRADSILYALKLAMMP